MLALVSISSRCLNITLLYAHFSFILPILQDSSTHIYQLSLPLNEIEHHLHIMQSNTSLGLDSCESLEDDEDSQYYDAYEGEEQSNNGIGELDDGALIHSPKSRCSTTRDGAGIRPSSARTASVPIASHYSTSHRRSSHTTSQTHSRPTTSGQTSSRGGSTAPTSTHSSRPNSRRYSALISLNGPSGLHPRDTRSLLHRSVTATPKSSATNHPSFFPINYSNTDDDDPPPTIRGVSYPGRSSENLASHSSPNLPLTPSSPTHNHQYSPTNIFGTDLAPAQQQQHLYTNYTPPANIEWTSSETRRKHYSKIDKATTGFRGVWTRFAPRRLGGGSKYGSFYGGKSGDAGSVRRFRQDLGDEGKQKRRFFGLGGKKGTESS